METPAEVDIVLLQGKNVVAKCQNLVLAVWAEAPSLAPMSAIHHSHLELLEEYPCVGHLAVINDTPRIPTPEAREMAAVYNKQSQMTSIAVVVDGEGFWLSAARGFLTAVLFAQRGQSRAQTQVFKELGQAIWWQGEMLKANAPDPRVIRDAMISMRALVE